MDGAEATIASVEFSGLTVSDEVIAAQSLFATEPLNTPLSNWLHWIQGNVVDIQVGIAGTTNGTIATDPPQLNRGIVRLCHQHNR
ncbi:hypothetical protein [Shewanella sp. YLB-07]|uniref:hypothetical protein n=1 Tax=Shewanella sp. YLB-07 TaxID=2601268 RepID=UPI00128C1A59|nr:hypothetical protein [Shewanella sp. YLB-07]MPY26904.1 hypothetical protein [Shewanella sp. YLB-07]